jgi:hypothetical protein
LAKKNQKPKAKDQFQFFSPSKSLRNAAEKIAIRSLSPKATAPLPMYDKFVTKCYISFLSIFKY